MAGGVRLVIADPCVDGGAGACLDHAQIGKPVAQDAPQIFRAGGITVRQHREGASREVLRIIPAFEFQRLGEQRVFTLGGGGVGVAAIGAYQPVDHQFQARRCLIPVHGAQHKHPVRSHPTRINVRHPVVGLTQCVVGITRTWPVAKRHRGGHAALARVYHF